MIIPPGPVGSDLSGITSKIRAMTSVGEELVLFDLRVSSNTTSRLFLKSALVGPRIHWHTVHWEGTAAYEAKEDRS